MCVYNALALYCSFFSIFAIWKGDEMEVMANTIDVEKEDPFMSPNDSDVEQETINEMDSDDETDEVI